MNKWLIGAVGAAIGAIGLRTYDYLSESYEEYSIRKTERKADKILAQVKKLEEELEEENSLSQEDVEEYAL